jgi:hypothetical protein
MAFSGPGKAREGEGKMKHKTWVVVCLAVLLTLGVGLSAGAQGKKMDLGGQKLGIIFNATSLLGNIAQYQDGLSAGMGMKYWFGDKSAVRALLEFSYTRDTAADTSTTAFGLSGAYLYHFVKGKVSPYTGGLAGVEISGSTGATTTVGLILGGILGAEVRVLDFLGLFGEYNLRLTYTEPNLDFGLAVGNGGSIGVIIYLP